MSTSQRAFRGMPDRLYPLPTLKVSGTSSARPPPPTLELSGKSSAYLFWAREPRPRTCYPRTDPGQVQVTC